MERDERKNLRCIEDLIYRNQIVIGVLKTNVPRTVIDRLNLAKVEQTGIVRCGGEAIGRLLPEHDANAVLQGLHDFRFLADFAGIHEIPWLNLNFIWLYLSDGISHLLDSLLRIVSWEQPPVEHDSALALDCMCGLGKTLDGVRRQTDLTQLRMSLLFRVRHQGFQFFKDLHRTFNGADAFPRPAAVRVLAPYDHQHIDTSFVPELNFRRAVDDAPIDFCVPVIEHMGERIVAPGFAGGA